VFEASRAPHSIRQALARPAHVTKSLYRSHCSGLSSDRSPQQNVLGQFPVFALTPTSIRNWSLGRNVLEGAYFLAPADVAASWPATFLTSFTRAARA